MWVLVFPLRSNLQKRLPVGGPRSVTFCVSSNPYLDPLKSPLISGNNFPLQYVEHTIHQLDDIVFTMHSITSYITLSYLLKLY